MMSRASRTGSSIRAARSAHASSSASAATDIVSSLTEPLLRFSEPERVDECVDVAAHDRGQVVRCPPDAMVGHATLRIVVRPDLRRAIAGADLRASHARALGL